MEITQFYFIAGSSGGHIVPAITVAEQYRSRYPNALFTFITTNQQLDKRIFSDYPWITHIHCITQPRFPGFKFWHYPSFAWQLFKSIKESWHILKNDSAYLISMGGNISIPGCIVAWFKNIPIDIYELNAIPGKAVRLTTFFARRLYICFPEAQDSIFSSKCILTPYPLRFKAAQQSIPSNAVTRPALLILGGSQGSLFINALIKDWYLRNKAFARQFTIFHQTGMAHLNDLKDFYSTQEQHAEVFDFCKNIDDYYKKADLVICRAGAGTLFETLFFEKRCITIPLEACAGNHQYENAVAITRRYPNLFTLVRQSDIENDPELFDYAIQINLDQDGQDSGFSPNPKT